MTRTRDEIQESRRCLKAECGKLFDSTHGTETNFTTKRCDVDSLVSTGTKTRAGHSGPCFRRKGVEMLFPLSDGVWAMFFRGMAFGFFGGLVLILLFFWSSGK